MKLLTLRFNVEVLVCEVPEVNCKIAAYYLLKKLKIRVYQAVCLRTDLDSTVGFHQFTK